MRFRYAAFLCLFLGSPQTAEPAAAPPRDALRLLFQAVPVPSEWAGVWTVTDSTYTCGLTLGDVNTSSDTLCAGVTVALPSDLGLDLRCAGKATATEVDQRCTASGTVLPGCTAHLDMQIEGTRTGDTFYLISTLEITYTGGACPLPPECFVMHSRGVRTQPASLCATPTLPTTWGRLRSLYR